MRSKEYAIWYEMIRRCHNPKAINYLQYGGRGITVCERWRRSREHWLEDMGPRPGPGFSIERINTNGSYEPENCCWADRTTQQRNRRDTIYLTHAGVTLSVWDWSDRTGIKGSTLIWRLQQGWGEAEIFRSTRPYNTRKFLSPVQCAELKQLHLQGWSERRLGQRYGITRSAVRSVFGEPERVRRDEQVA